MRVTRHYYAGSDVIEHLFQSGVCPDLTEIPGAGPAHARFLTRTESGRITKSLVIMQMLEAFQCCSGCVRVARQHDHPLYPSLTNRIRSYDPLAQCSQ